MMVTFMIDPTMHCTVAENENEKVDLLTCRHKWLIAGLIRVK